MQINPIKIQGSWDEGYALDIHTISSTPIGEDAFGNMRFETIRSDMGELLFQFKYKNKYNRLDKIISLAKPFIMKWDALKTVETVMPIPPSIERLYQPSHEIAQEIAAIIGAHYVDNILIKNQSVQSKNLTSADKNQVVGTIHKVRKANREHDMLLVDDLFKTGSTIEECVRILKTDKKIKKIFILTMTKTKR